MRASLLNMAWKKRNVCANLFHTLRTVGGHISSTGGLHLIALYSITPNTDDDVWCGWALKLTVACDFCSQSSTCMCRTSGTLYQSSCCQNPEHLRGTERRNLPSVKPCFDSLHQKAELLQWTPRPTEAQRRSALSRINDVLPVNERHVQNKAVSFQAC